MSDRLPPNGGPGPFDGRDLDDLLSGKDVWLPEGMRPVRAALDAVRSGAMREEVAGEAAAVAMFREIWQSGGEAEVSPGARNLPERATGTGAHVVTGPRHARRRQRQRVRWRSKALVSGVAGGAAVVLAGGMALMGAFPGFGGHSELTGHGAGIASVSTSSSHSGSSGLDGKATTVPTVHPTPTWSATAQPSASQTSTSPDTAQLCLRYLDYLTHPGGHAHRAAELQIQQRLSRLAGNKWRIPGYCARLPWASTQSESSISGITTGQWPPAAQAAAGQSASSQGAGAASSSASPAAKASAQPSK